MEKKKGWFLEIQILKVKLHVGSQSYDYQKLLAWLVVMINVIIFRAFLIPLTQFNI